MLPTLFQLVAQDNPQSGSRCCRVLHNRLCIEASLPDAGTTEKFVFFFKIFNLNLVVQISGLVSSPGVLEHGVGSMELPIAVSADENSTALSSCHSELLLEEVGSLDAVAMHGGVDLLLVGLPRLIIITIIIIIVITIIIISIICQACSSSSLGSQSFLPVRNVGRIVGVRKQRSVPACNQRS